jgi:hypothetical protein
MNEFQVTNAGQLDLGIEDMPGRGLPSAGYDPAGYDLADNGPPPDDDWAEDIWASGDLESDPDDYEAWLAGLPADIRAEFLAGAWTGAGESIPAGFLHHMRGGPSGAGFASGGVLDAMTPGPALADALGAVTANGHSQLGESELIGVLCAWRRISAWAAAGEAAAVVALASRRAAQSREPRRSDLAEHVIDEIAAALTLTGRSADRLLSVASGLARLADVFAALKRGEIDWAKACVFVDELAVMTDDVVADAIATTYLGRAGAGGWTTGQLRAALRRAVLAADPQAAERRRQDARKEAEVRGWDEPSGNAALAGRELPPAEVLAADARLTALANWLQQRGAAGTISQLRAAVYTALLNGRPIDSLLPAEGSSNPVPDDNGVHGDNPVADDNPAPGDNPECPAVSGTIHLTMPLSAWLGGHEPGEVAGRGPVDAFTGRELAAKLAESAATSWCLTVTGANGRAVGHSCAAGGPVSGEPLIKWAAGLRSKLKILETGGCSHARRSAGYRPPRSLRHLIVVRQRRCCFPGCRYPAVRCDLDHTVPFDKGGRTCECNLAPLCRHHHRCKQAEGWRLEQPGPGRMIWRTPSGRDYETSGDAY